MPGQPVEGPVNKVPEIEWEKAEKGELQEIAELPVPDALTEKEKPEEESVKEEEILPPRPSMDIFKAIFANSDSEEEDEEKEEVPSKSTDINRTVAFVPEPIAEKEEQETEEDSYGPKLPRSSAITGSASFSLTKPNIDGDQDEWVERRETTENKKKKDKKDKKSKKKKEKKSKKRKRRHSDKSSTSEDEDVKILKKIAALKKQKKL